MALSLTDKKAVVAEVAEVAKKAVSVVAADYHGLSVAEMTELRRNARESGVILRVVRNTLARRAFEDTDFSCMSEVLTGPLFLAFSEETPSAAARLVRDFAKEHEQLEVRALSLNGKLLGAESLAAIASLPTRDEALALLAYVMKAPVTQLARTFSETYAKLVRAVAAVGEQKKAA